MRILISNQAFIKEREVQARACTKHPNTKILNVWALTLCLKLISKVLQPLDCVSITAQGWWIHLLKYLSHWASGWPTLNNFWASIFGCSTSLSWSSRNISLYCSWLELAYSSRRNLLRHLWGATSEIKWHDNQVYVIAESTITTSYLKNTSQFQQLCTDCLRWHTWVTLSLDLHSFWEFMNNLYHTLSQPADWWTSWPSYPQCDKTWMKALYFTRNYMEM